MALKLKSVSANNFANFDEIKVSFDPNLTYLAGGNGEGKSTLGVDILWVVLQGIGSRPISKDNFPVIAERYQVIGPKSPSAKLSVTLHDTKTKQDIIVRRKVLKDGNELSFEGPDGMVLDQRFLNDIFNLFLISPKKFLQLSPRDQSVALGIDLSEFDKKIKGLKEEFTGINRDLKSIGMLVEVPLTEAVNVLALVEEKKVKVLFNNEQTERQAGIDKTTEALTKLREETLILDHAGADCLIIYKSLEDIFPQLEIAEAKEYVQSCLNYLTEKIKTLSTKEKANKDRIKAGDVYLKSLPKVEPLKDISQLDQQIAQASEINVNASKYQEYLKAKQRKETLEVGLQDNKLAQREAEKMRTEKIQSYDLPFKDLSINEEGELMLQGRYLKEEYFSTGELIRTIPMLIISSMKRKGEIKFPFCYIQDFSLLDSENQKQVIEFFQSNGIQAVFEVVSDKPLGKSNEIYLKDNRIISQGE